MRGRIFPCFQIPGCGSPEGRLVFYWLVYRFKRSVQDCWGLAWKSIKTRILLGDFLNWSKNYTHTKDKHDAAKEEIEEFPSPITWDAFPNVTSTGEGRKLTCFMSLFSPTLPPPNTYFTTLPPTPWWRHIREFFDLVNVKEIWICGKYEGLWRNMWNIWRK